MSKFFIFVSNLFKNDLTGKPDVIKFLVTIIILTVLGNWSYICVVKQEFISLNISDVAAIVGPLLAHSWSISNEKPTGKIES